MGGHPAFDKPIPAMLKIDDDGVHLVKGFAGRKTLVSVPWDSIDGLHAEGPDQIQTRFTATRLALIGPFALAFKKDKKSDCFVVVESSQGEFLFQVRSKSQHELRGALAPWATRVRGKGGSESTESTVADDDRIQRLKDLGELRAQGILTEEEFASEKARVLGT